MPTFARTKLQILDYCFLPYRKVHLNYTGPNPQLAYEQVRKLIKQVFKVTDGDIQETNFVWDRSQAEEKFKITMRILKDLDKFSYYDIEVEVKGFAKPSKEFGKEGQVEVAIEPRLMTEYPQDTWWQRLVIYDMFRVIFHRVFYQEKRKKFIEECKDNTALFFDQLKAFFNLLRKKK